MRRRVVPERRARLSKRSQLRHVAESEELSDSSTVSESEEPTQPSRALVDEEEKRRDASDDESEDEDTLDFTQTDYATQHLSQRSEPSEAVDRESSGKAKSPSVPSKIAQLSDKAVDDLTAQLVRYMLYKGGLKQPIKFGDISKDVYPTYKNISRFFFHRAKKQLERVFGYQVVPVDDVTAKEVYLVINATSSQEHWQLLNKTGKSPARGLLMMILEDLWRQLALVDSRVKATGEHEQLGDVSQLLKTFEAQMYLLGSTEIDNDAKKVKFYTYGARTHKEVGKPQILNFVCKLITGRPPTDTQLDEVLMEDK